MPVATEAPALATALAADGLAGSRLTLPDKPLDNAAWPGLLTVVDEQRLPGFLLQAINNGRMPVTAEQLDAASVLHRDAMGVALHLERTLLKTVEALERSGIPTRVLKGPAVAHLVYRDPSLRAFYDVDLMIPAADFERALDVLGREGCTRQQRRLGPGYDARFGKGASLVANGGWEVDLHRTFVGGRFGLGIQLDDLFATSSPFRLGGRTLQALGPEESFLHACYHAAIGDPVPRLMTLRDIAEMLLRTSLDLDRIRGLCGAWGGLPVMARAVRLTWETFGLADLTALSVWAERYKPTRSEERAVRAYTTKRSGGGQALTSLGAIPGVRSKVMFIRAVVLPEREFLSGSPRRAWAGRGARSAVRLVRRNRP